MSMWNKHIQKWLLNQILVTRQKLIIQLSSGMLSKHICTTSLQVCEGSPERAKEQASLPCHCHTTVCRLMLMGQKQEVRKKGRQDTVAFQLYHSAAANCNCSTLIMVQLHTFWRLGILHCFLVPKIIMHNSNGKQWRRSSKFRNLIRIGRKKLILWMSLSHKCNLSCYSGYST